MIMASGLVFIDGASRKEFIVSTGASFALSVDGGDVASNLGIADSLIACVFSAFLMWNDESCRLISFCVA